MPREPLFKRASPLRLFDRLRWILEENGFFANRALTFGRWLVAFI
jgi:hypothetical protein